MIFSESTNIAVGRIEEIEPCGAYKMVECLLSLGWGDREMTQFTLSPDDVVKNMITKKKNILDFDGVILREPNPENYNPSGLPKLGAKRVPRRLFSLAELPSNICQYFRKGFCRHGSNCKYSHDVSMTVPISQFSNLNSNDDHHFFRAGSIEVLGMEIAELLRSRNGNPIPVHLLPATYYGMYGKTIETEGYHNLVKLLTHLKNILCVIDRHEGLILVILACDAVNYMTYASPRIENGCIVPRSRQIYLTFPSESSFSVLDLFNYFSAYGPVQDVRIPCQEKRMFAFVAFVYPEPVQKLLALSKPHFISGSRVLVKPYKEKSRLKDRNHLEMLQRSIPSDLQSFGRESEYTVPNAGNNSSDIKNGPAEDIIETVDPKNHSAESLVLMRSNSDDELKLPEEPSEFRFPLHPRSGIRKKLINSSTINNSDQELDRIINLPDSLFARYMNPNSD